MARAISDIKKGMTEQFMAEPVIREKYGLLSGDTFDEKFSKVSLENILFFIVASAIYALEAIFDMFKMDVEETVNKARVATVPWYYHICKAFQLGDELVYNETTSEFGYETVDNSKMIIRYASIREAGSGVKVLVSKEQNGSPVPLTASELNSFKRYLNSIKPAGILTDVRSYAPDSIRIYLSVQYDCMVLADDGTLISEPGRKPVDEAIRSYLSNIMYGGVFNKTKLVDAVQQAEGIVDVCLEQVVVKSAVKEEFSEVTGNNLESLSGSFKVESLNETINYVQQL